MSVHRSLGCSFLESVYENALAIELHDQNISFERQVPFDVSNKNRLAGRYFTDMVVEDRLLLEPKAASNLTPIFEAQLLNYLKASNIHVGLLLNFGTRSLQIKRMTKDFKETRNI
jgi:GxxExxY protein